MKENVTVAFAFYRGGELLGYRQDTLGSIGDKPKLYTYSQSQVETVIRNVMGNISESRPAYVQWLKDTDPRVGSFVANSLRNAHNLLNEGVVVEMRVVKAPSYEWYTEYRGEDNKELMWPIYPVEEVKEWLKTPEDHETIETHYFSKEGEIILQ
jgi:hypothetical protein